MGIAKLLQPEFDVSARMGFPSYPAVSDATSCGCDRDMGGSNLNNRRVEALGHGPLQGWLDSAIVGRDEVATRLAPPCRRRDCTAQGGACCWRLGGVEDKLFRVT